MQRDDLIRLRHMLDASEDALSFVKGKSRDNLDKDRMLVLSIVKSLEIVGEAASKVSKESQTELKDVPWPNIITMRNRLIHAYFDINLDIVWETVKEDLPLLVAVLRRFIINEE